MNPRPFPERLVLLGHPLGHSRSPVIQNAALRAASIPLSYELLDVPRSALDDTIAALRRERAAGNVTRPYKEYVLEASDRLSDAARRIGAVNTFWCAVDGALVGDNTDSDGFAAAVDRLRAPTDGACVALLGAGGGAAAVLHAMEGWGGATVRVHARTPDRAERLLERFQIPGTIVPTPEEAVRGSTLIVNATPIGLLDDRTPVNPDALEPDALVLDLAYRAGDTELVRAARARGLRAADGTAMLVEQGALSFERWFGITPDRSVMWQALAQH